MLVKHVKQGHMCIFVFTVGAGELFKRAAEFHPHHQWCTVYREVTGRALGFARRGGHKAEQYICLFVWHLRSIFDDLVSLLLSFLVFFASDYCCAILNWYGVWVSATYNYARRFIYSNGRAF